MIKRRTLNEQIARMKKLANINENELKLDSPEFENELETTLKDIVKDTVNDLGTIGNEVGDKDGKLEIVENNLNEAGLGLLVAGTALAAPKIADLLGKGLGQIGKKVDNETIEKWGEKLSNVGHKVHSMYENAIISGLKRLYPGNSDDFYKGAATAILLSATVALGISSISTAISAAQAGQAGLAAVEGGLGGVKATEIAQAAKSFLPRVLSGFLK